MDIRKATRILEYWLGIEYLMPSELPKANPKEKCWDIKHDHDWPWVDREKQHQLFEDTKFTWRFLIYGGLVDMHDVARSLKDILDIKKEDNENFSSSKPTAIISLSLDLEGKVAGLPCISSIPWAMGQIIKSQDGSLDFEGFEEFEKNTRTDLLEFLINRQLIAPAYAKEQGLNPNKVSLRSVTLDDLNSSIEFFLSKAGWKPQTPLVKPARVSTLKASRTAPRDSQADMLNSFVASDIAMVRRAIQTGDYGEGLAKYLFGEHSDDRIDVVHDGGKKVLAATMPSHLPLGRWPSEHPLVLSQQFAVNSIMDRLRNDSGIFSINGPPGTGKTTLLRDIVAALVVERACKLADLGDNPTLAFPEKMTIRNSKFPAWKVRESIGGFGMVVASANNGAVENVTKELPMTKAIDPIEMRFDYYAKVAESVLAGRNEKNRRPGSCWGLISAILGKRENRTDFVNRFWFSQLSKDDKVSPDAFWSFQMAVEEAAEGTPSWLEARRDFLDALKKVREAIKDRDIDAKLIEEIDSATIRVGDLKLAISKLKSEVSSLENDAVAAKREKNESEERYHLAHENHELALEHLEAVSALQRHTMAYRSIIKSQPSSDKTLLQETRGKLDNAEPRLIEMKQSAERRLQIQLATPPNILVRIFIPSRVSAWKNECLKCETKITELGSKINELHRRSKDINRQLQEIDSWAESLRSAEKTMEEAKKRISSQFPTQVPSLEDTKSLLDKAASRRSFSQMPAHTVSTVLKEKQAELHRYEQEIIRKTDRIIECEASLHERGITQDTRRKWALDSIPGNEREKSTPWFDEKLYILRHELFLEALKLHKSFIRANKKALFANLSHFMDLLKGSLLPSSVSGGVSHLWESFFLVVPVVSTTFSSVSSLFMGLGQESLGWLLIDEAGQATPESAVGAIWRAKRTVVVGDPNQLEPVVTIPPTAIDALGERCKIENHWHPILYSCQALADEANIVGTYINNLWVGSPLRVHRRCLNPMFKVANQIAYDGLMVYATALSATEQQKEWLGESCWIDVPSDNADGHWIPQQGALAVNIVKEIIRREGGVYQTDGTANVYVVTPFKDVNKHLYRSLNQYVDLKKDKIAGTIHTFQGKEANIVVLLLGGDPEKPRAISGFAAEKPNLLNVALTRAKRRIYVIGDRKRWSSHDYFKDLSNNLPSKNSIKFMDSFEEHN